MESRFLHCCYNPNILCISIHIQYCSQLEAGNRTLQFKLKAIRFSDGEDRNASNYCTSHHRHHRSSSDYLHIHYRCRYLRCWGWTFENLTPLDNNFKHSLWLLLSILILCIPCTMADVVCMPLIGSLSSFRIFTYLHLYLGRLGSPDLVTTFYVGMGLGALLPSALSFAQGIPLSMNSFLNYSETLGINGSTWNFSYSVFIYIICVLDAVSLVGLVNILTGSTIPIRSAYFGILYLEKRKVNNNDEERTRTLSQTTTETKVEQVPVEVPTFFSPYISSVPLQVDSSLRSMLFPMLVTLIASSFQNAVLPAILPYATQPFEPTVMIPIVPYQMPFHWQIYSLSTNLFVLTNPIFCFVQHFYSFSSTIHLSILSIITAIPTLFILVLSIAQLSIPAALLPVSVLQ